MAVEGLNAIPLTEVEKLDCSKTLTPQDIKKIGIGKMISNYGLDLHCSSICSRFRKTHCFHIKFFIMILVDSALIDFGEVCQRSVKTKYLTVGNNLNQCIHIVVNVSMVKNKSN